VAQPAALGKGSGAAGTTCGRDHVESGGGAGPGKALGDAGRRGPDDG
jgi:hypothetical protein